MRLIDADALKEKIDSMWNGRPLSVLGARILATIDEALTIEIIRCKECKHSPKNTKEIPLHDSCYTFGDDDFCSYGEKQTETNSSEKPNNSTISKMEQVEDEPQTERRE